MTKKRVKYGIGIDVGTGNLAISIFDGKRLTTAECPVNGPQVPTIAYHETINEKWYFGRLALQHSYDDTGDNLYMHFKRAMYANAHEKMFGGGRFSAVELTAELLRYAKQLIIASRPELESSLGSEESEEVAVCLTAPANWGIEQHSALGEAAKMAGFPEVMFAAEPIVVARRLMQVGDVTLEHGDIVLVVDIGAGTTDIALLAFNEETRAFDQLKAASGDAYFAGHDLTNAIAAAVAKQCRVSWKGVFGREGLNLSKVSGSQRHRVVACSTAAEEIKRQLSAVEETTVVVDLPNGRKMFSLNREQALALWATCREEFKQCVSEALKGSDFDFSDIKHAMLAGGSSKCFCLREDMAAAIGREVQDIIVCTDSEHIVSGGAAELALGQERTDQALESGFGFIVEDEATGERRPLLIIEPGEVIEANGFFIERTGFSIDTSQGHADLTCEGFVCRTGIRREAGTYLDSEEILLLEPVRASLPDLDQARHEVTLGIDIDAGRKVNLLVRFDDNQNVEPISVPLSVLDGRSKKPAEDARVILLLLDCSGSMYQEEKLERLQVGAKTFIAGHLSHGVQIGVIAFGLGKLEGRVALACEVSSSLKKLNAAVDSLARLGGGGTPMGAALSLANESFPSKDGIAILFTDGQPGDPYELPARTLKEQHQLITVGIGADVQEPLLRRLASGPGDYFFAECAVDIGGSFEAISARLGWNANGVGEDYPEVTKDASGGTRGPLANAGAGDYEVDWDEIEEEVA